MIPCPECGALGHRVIESRYQPKENAKRRRCVCKACGYRFTTQLKERLWTGKPEPDFEPEPFTPPGSIWLTRLDRLEASLAELQESLPRSCPPRLPIEALDLRTVRAFNGLKRAGVNTLDHLLTLTPADLLEIRRFGTTSLADVVMALDQLGLELPREHAKASPPRCPGRCVGL